MTRRNGRHPAPIDPDQLEKLLREGGTRWCEGCQMDEDFCFDCSVRENKPVFHHKE